MCCVCMCVCAGCVLECVHVGGAYVHVGCVLVRVCVGGGLNVYVGCVQMRVCVWGGACARV